MKKLKILEKALGLEKKKSRVNEIIEILKSIKQSKKEKDNPEYIQMISKIMENIPKANEYYSKIEKDQRGKINPRIPGIFILFDNINFYFLQIHKYQFFSDYKTSIPQLLEELELTTTFELIECYLKEYTNIQAILESKNITFDDIVSDYILYFISKSEKLQKDSCDIKYIYKILSNLFEIKKKNENLKDYKYFINIIIIFNCYCSHITYPLNAIKFLNDENIIEDIYTKILKEITQYEKESDIIFIIIESFFNLLINEILINNKIISKLNYIHIFLMNIINTLNLKSQNFYIYMQFKSLYQLIQKEEDNKLLYNIYSEIYKLKSVFSNLNQKNESLKSYLTFYEYLRSECKINDYSALRIFIVDFFYYELKKYQENEELFPIILDVLSENNGDAFIGSKKIFNIFLKKYIFEEPLNDEEECRKILENGYRIKKDNKNENIGKKEEYEMKKEDKKDNEGKDVKEEKISEKNENKEEEEEEEEKKDIEDNNEKKDEKDEPEKINKIKEDLFLKKYNEIITTRGNQKIKVIIDEIIQQFFGYYFNGYFMSHFDKKDYSTIFFDENKLFLKICIEFLENLKKPFVGKEVSIFLANGFIQSFLYVFINYFFENINDKNEYAGDYNLDNILKIVKGKSKFRRVVQIYIFRLIYYKINNFKKFKNFDVRNDSFKSFVNQFLETYSFEDPPFKLISYCKKLFEDFFNDDKESLPKSYQLRGYEFDNMFPYDNNIINVKMINNYEFSTSSINTYENNSQFISRMAVLIISSTFKDLIDRKEFNEINNEINNIFKKNNKSIIPLFNEAMFELTGNLHLNLINEFKNLISPFPYYNIIQPIQKNEAKKEEINLNENYIPEINSKDFESNSNKINQYNERTLGIFLYSLKISLTTFIFDEKEKYFYSYLIMTENSSEEIINILDNSYIPGYNLSKKGLNTQNKSKDYYNDRWTTISTLTLRFILFSNLFFNILTKKLNDNDIKKYTIEDENNKNKNNKTEKYSCLRMIFFIWNIIEKKLIKNETPIIEIYFNLIIKYLPYILKKCTREAIKKTEETKIFEEYFHDFIIACLQNYKEYSLNFIDTQMKYIIQELNNPLKYNFDEFPFLEYYTVQSNPNNYKIINKIGNGNYLILNHLFNSEYKEKIENHYKDYINVILICNLGKYFTNSINGESILVIKEINEYSKLFELLKIQYRNLAFKIDHQIKFPNNLEKIINNIKERINEMK